VVRPQLTWPKGQRIAHYVAALAAIAAVTVLLFPLRGVLHNSVIPLVYLVVVLFIATAWRMGPAIVGSLAGSIAYDFFFIPPYDLAINLQDTDELTAVSAFLITSVTAGQLSARAKRRAEEAEAGRKKIESLYAGLQQENAARMRAQELLEKQAAELQEQAQLLDLAHDAIVVRDLDGRIMFWNQGASQRYGWSKNEALNQRTHELLKTEFPQPLKEINASLQQEGFWEGELRHTRKDGRNIVVVSRWVLKPGSSTQAPGVLEINSDVTERKQAEEALRRAHDELEVRVRERTSELRSSNESLQLEVQERKRTEAALALRSEELTRSNAELEQFAYVASHDLQEPLRMVGSFVQLLERRYKDVLDAKGREHIGYAVDGARRMQMLIQDLLAFSRVGTQGKEFTPTNFNSVVRSVLNNLREAIGESGAKVKCDPLPTLRADGTQIGQLFQNLISNAVKFRGEHSPTIQITAEPTDNCWKFAVRDNGIGIDQRHSERIFLIFQRLHSRREYVGTGIGLAICKKIVDRHGGRIWVESEPGEGSTFLFTLPNKGGGRHGPDESC
jgi:PAS domain S-box-containing protein